MCELVIRFTVNVPFNCCTGVTGSYSTVSLPSTISLLFASPSFITYFSQLPLSSLIKAIFCLPCAVSTVKLMKSTFCPALISTEPIPLLIKVVGESLVSVGDTGGGGFSSGSAGFGGSGGGGSTVIISGPFG
ncbi:hypothetical protein HS327_01030 [Glaesserella parasuis]|nr:hypothetical protein HS327_01030 [Glaesserella parasuis]